MLWDLNPCLNPGDFKVNFILTTTELGCFALRDIANQQWNEEDSNLTFLPLNQRMQERDVVEACFQAVVIICCCMVLMRN